MAITLLLTAELQYRHEVFSITAKKRREIMNYLPGEYAHRHLNTRHWEGHNTAVLVFIHSQVCAINHNDVLYLIKAV